MTREKPVDILNLHGAMYRPVLQRQRGAGVYTNVDRSLYLRIGSPELVAKERDFHKELLRLGFPVAKILEEGNKDGQIFWVEESLGEKRCADFFMEDCKMRGEIGERAFAAWLAQVKCMAQAQTVTSKRETYDFDALALSTGEAGMEEELPDIRDAIRAAWLKAQGQLVEVPMCYTHGDFSAHNIFERGVIDFGDHFQGPLGYDWVTAITCEFWFPADSSFEYYQQYQFSERQIDRFFAEVGGRDHFDVLFFLKANWWAVRNFRAPKLQVYRYEKYREVIRRYLAGESLEEYWRGEK